MPSMTAGGGVGLDGERDCLQLATIASNASRCRNLKMGIRHPSVRFVPENRLARQALLGQSASLGRPPTYQAFCGRQRKRSVR